MNINSIRPTVKTGNANTSSREIIRVIQVNTGMRIRVIPGARILRIVTMKLQAAAKDETPSTCNPHIKKSVPAPEYSVAVRGA